MKLSREEPGKGQKRKLEPAEKAIEVIHSIFEYFQKENTLRPFFIDVLYLSSIFFKTEISTVYLKTVMDKILQFYGKVTLKINIKLNWDYYRYQKK